MAGDWPLAPLPDLVTLQRGHDLPSQDRNAGRFKVVAATGQVGTHNEYRADAPGVVIGRSGSIGGAQFIDEPFWPLNTTLYVKDFKGNDPRFCYYLLQSIDFQRFNVGSGVPTLNRNHLDGLMLPAPEKHDQTKISDFFGALDKKIELNRQMAVTLEDMARTLFKSWFLDFDPVQAKVEGRETGLPSDIAALFPDGFSNDGLPRGWTNKPLDQVLELSYGKSLRAESRKDGIIPVYGSGGITGFHTEAIVDGPGVIVGRKGSVGTLYWERRSFFPIDTVFYATPKGEIPLEVIWYMLNSFPLKDMNTDGAVPGLSRAFVYQLEFCIATSELLVHFTTITKNIREKIDVLYAESEKIELLKRVLLPKMLSGQLRIDENISSAAAA